MTTKKYIIETVGGDGHFYPIGESSTERLACRRALKAQDLTGLRHTGTWLPIGAVRVICPDGAVLVGIDIEIGANFNY